jgi:two-component system, chemotaxis family, sensor kinase CheA
VISMTFAQDPELIADFVLESREHLARVEAQLLLLDTDPCNKEALHVCFRAFHAIKGLAGFLEFGQLQQFCHEAEALLDGARNGTVAVTVSVIDVLLAACDFVSSEVNYIETGSPAYGSELRCNAEPVLERIRLLTQELAPAVALQEGRLLKVDSTKLDRLVEVVGELVIAQHLVRSDPALTRTGNTRLTRNLWELGRITNELQKATLSIRMVPIGPLFAKMTRLVRGLSRKSGKVVDLDVRGEGIELDSNIVEELADPLMQILRNAIDHGIETPEERGAAGKPARAKIKLAAERRAGHIVVQVSDDGRGLNREKIMAKALAHGLITGTANMPDQDVFTLIFEAGLSTVEQVTNLSGRGVGLDVVRKQIHKLRGRIETQSSPGAGTMFTLRVPLTLAIIDEFSRQLASTRDCSLDL